MFLDFGIATEMAKGSTQGLGKNPVKVLESIVSSDHKGLGTVPIPTR
jgi:hypothetical protein